MNCHNPACKKDFNPDEEKRFGDGMPNGEIQIIAPCPHCNADHYTFVKPDDFILAE
jgi:hypothetical protein